MRRVWPIRGILRACFSFLLLVILTGSAGFGELEAMDQKFVSACEAAFKAGLESRAAAAATVRVGSLRNGKEAAIEGIIESAWRYLRTNMDAGVDVTFLEVAARSRCVPWSCL